MKILKLLSKIIFLNIVILINLNIYSYSEEQPVDIWNLEEQKSQPKVLNDQNKSEISNEQSSENNVYDLQSSKSTNKIDVEESFQSSNVKIFGLYDPEDYSLKIDMWSNSDGDELKYLFSNLSKLELSEDAAEIMNISLLTNSYIPKKNISEKEFLKIKSDWLIKNNDLNLIQEYLVKNQLINISPNLVRYLADQYLSKSNISKACEIFEKNIEPIYDEYLSKLNIYCLINKGKNEEAQLILDLKKELGFQNKYFEKKINFLQGYTSEVDNTISEKSILEFHLAHRTNPEFSFEPKENTNKLIWKYLATSNLLYKIDEIEITDFEKISIIEKATNDKNYFEKDLFDFYKRFQFNINQLLNAIDSHKTLSNIEARALIYQRILLESEINKKLELIKVLKNLFIKDNLSNAFDSHLKDFLNEINPDDVPSNFTTFYYNYLKTEEKSKTDIKFDNDVLHQSKLINYFNGDYAKSKIEKDIDNFLKKIKKNKKYVISKKDKMFLESIKSDGIEISKKYKDLYKIDESEMPSDMQVMINNREIGATLLRIIQVIGQDRLQSLDDDTLYFIISALNQLDIDFIRNKILLKVLPLKV